ncbi:MAG: AAA family ATPase [Deltaproteobacteria bacterium]|nr:AAA family ATPase [Deltaproteobacteria bacterium]
MMTYEGLKRLQTALKSQFIERDRLIDGTLLAVLSRQHVLMLGPPGTAKSMLAKEVCRHLGRTAYFEWLLTKFTTPEEIFGPVSLPALERGQYERVTKGKLPEAEIAFVDEIFKANSAILNALLTILNERRFHHGSQAVEVPLETLLAASNELPEEDELAALYDRFLLRFTVGYIEQDYRFARLLRLDAKNQAPLDAPTLDPDELRALQQRATEVLIPDGILQDIIEIRKALNAEGVIASDRRYRASLSVLRAAALLEGRTEVTTSDLAWLEHILWSDPEEQPKVRAALAQIATGLEEDARKLVIQAQEVDAYARRDWPDTLSKNRAILEAHTKLEDIHRRMEALRLQGEARARDVSRIAEFDREVVSMQTRLLQEQDAWNG